MIKHFKEKLAVFKPKGRNKKYGFIDKTGIIKIEPKFTHVNDFKNGLSEVIIGTEYENFKYGYINQKGEEIWEPRR
ncbi:MAG: WG repeat-containing protein [Saprospiraceae bacterium]|nr:WG repeat-containing protein [Saprospiraceae bacterium]